MFIRDVLLRMQARYNGKLDGQRGRPSEESESISYFVIKRRAAGENSKPLLHEVKCATYYEQKLCKVADQNVRKVYQKWQSLDAELIPRHKNAQHKFRQAEENYLQRKDRLGRDPVFNSMPFWYMPLIFVFGIAELAMNAQVFDIFGSARFETIIMALILSFAIPVSGHFWGRFLREDQKERPLIFLSIGTLAVIMFSLYSLAAVRYSFFKALTPNNEETIFNAWLFFLSLNFLIFMVSVFASWYSHERDFRLLKFKRDYMAVLREIHKIEGKRNALKSDCHNRAFQIRDRMHEVISIYRHHNLRRRRSDARPKAFENLPEILIPEFEEEQFANTVEIREIAKESATPNHNRADELAFFTAGQLPDKVTADVREITASEDMFVDENHNGQDNSDGHSVVSPPLSDFTTSRVPETTRREPS
jgi:hypothetical protein